MPLRSFKKTKGYLSDPIMLDFMIHRLGTLMLLSSFFTIFN